MPTEGWVLHSQSTTCFLPLVATRTTFFYNQVMTFETQIENNKKEKEKRGKKKEKEKEYNVYLRSSEINNKKKRKCI